MMVMVVMVVLVVMVIVVPVAASIVPRINSLFSSRRMIWTPSFSRRSRKLPERAVHAGFIFDLLALGAEVIMLRHN
jgi:hypothetical protein